MLSIKYKIYFNTLQIRPLLYYVNESFEKSKDEIKNKHYDTIKYLSKAVLKILIEYKICIEYTIFKGVSKIV